MFSENGEVAKVDAERRPSASAGATSAGAPSKLDAMSREDLLRIVKKQLVNLRVAKEQIETLKTEEQRSHAEIATLSSKLSSAPPSNQSESGSEHGEAAKRDDFSGTMISMELADYKRSAEQLRTELKEVRSESERREGLIGELSTRLSSVSQEREVAQEALRQSNGELSRLKSMLEEKSKEITENSKEINALVVQISQMKADMEQEIGTLNATVMRQRQQLTVGASKDTSRAGEVRRLTTENDTLRGQLSELRSEHERFKERAEFVLKQREARVEELTAATTLSQQQRSPIGADAESQLTVRQKEKFEQLHSKCSLLEEELLGARQQISLLRTELDDSQREFTDARRKWESERSLIASKLQQQVNHLEAVVDNQRHELDDVRNAGEERQLRREKLAEQRIEELTKENAALKATEESLRRELKTHRDGPMASIGREPVCQAKKPAAAVLPTPLDIIGSATRDRPRTVPIAASAERYSPLANRLDNDGRAKMKDADSDDEEHYLENLILSDALSVDGESAAGGRRSASLATIPINHFGASLESRWEEGPSFEELQELHQSSAAQLEHTRELLAESEETNAKLTDQVKLLKEEIRRMERNHERVTHVNNSSEYLKNVMLKFLAPEQVNDQRYQLLPVLATMLKLSREELDSVRQSVADSGGPLPQAETTPTGTAPSDAGWSSYFGSLLS